MYILAIETILNFEVLLLGAIASSSPTPTRFDVRSGIGEEEVSSLLFLKKDFLQQKTTSYNKTFLDLAFEVQHR